MRATTQDRGTKRPREEVDDKHVDTANIHVEVTTGEGVTVKLQLPPTATVLKVKQEVESELGIRSREACVFSMNEAHTEKLQDEETVESLLVEEEAKLELSLLVEQADMQQVVPELAAEPSLVLGDETQGARTRAAMQRSLQGASDTQFGNPLGVAFVAAHPDWLVTSELLGDRIKISNIRTGALVCKFGEYGEGGEYDEGEGEFAYPFGVAVTSDSSFVIVTDCDNHRVQVLRLVVGADGNSAHLEFVRFLGSAEGNAEGELNSPAGVALLQSNGGQQETVLVTEGGSGTGGGNHRVSQFALDGTFIGIFAGTGKEGSGDGEFKDPQGIAVLGSSGEVAVADFGNHRVQIFDSEGKYKRQFGSYGDEADGQLCCPASLTSDAHGNLLVTDDTSRLQVFSPAGKHLCTHSDLGLQEDSKKGIAWSADGEIAVTNDEACTVFFWHSA
jgi:DNA-binding beta-propeller fold protein YncE